MPYKAYTQLVIYGGICKVIMFYGWLVGETVIVLTSPNPGTSLPQIDPDLFSHDR